jgi:hypothetical protein
MPLCVQSGNGLDASTRTFYRQALSALNAAQVPFLVGGAYAFACYVDIIRHTKDLDVFVLPSHQESTLEVLRTAGFHTELTFPHWLGKAFSGADCIDVIFSSGNGVAVVDEAWFTHAVEAEVLGVPVRLCPPEEMLWSKAYIMERERYDGADIAHLLHACSTRLDWPRLLGRFGPHWRVLLSYLMLFGFIYPAEHRRIPDWVMQELLDRLHHELHGPPPATRLCQGTLLSRAQFLIDINSWGYQDARLMPKGNMTLADVAHWTAAIGEGGSNDEHQGEAASSSSG